MPDSADLTTRDVFAQIDRNFRWTLGITMASWLSLMTTLLLK
jgi:hypothetical protein